MILRRVPPTIKHLALPGYKKIHLKETEWSAPLLISLEQGQVYLPEERSPLEPMLVSTTACILELVRNLPRPPMTTWSSLTGTRPLSPTTWTWCRKPGVTPATAPLSDTRSTTASRQTANIQSLNIRGLARLCSVSGLLWRSSGGRNSLATTDMMSMMPLFGFRRLMEDKKIPIRFHENRLHWFMYQDGIKIHAK